MALLMAFIMFVFFGDLGLGLTCISRQEVMGHCFVITKKFLHGYYYINYLLLICDIPYLCCLGNIYLKTFLNIKLRKSIIHIFYALCNN